MNKDEFLGYLKIQMGSEGEFKRFEILLVGSSNNVLLQRVLSNARKSELVHTEPQNVSE